jgi:hypothetical protein
MSQAPHTQDLVADAPPVAIAADFNQEIGAVTESGGGTVSRVAVTPNAAIVGTAMPNSRHWSLFNRTKGIVVATLQLAAGVNPAAGVETVLPITGNAAVAQNDILEFQSVHDGTGLVDPGVAVRVTVTRDLSQH